MKFEKRYIPLILITLYGFIYALWFTSGFISAVFERFNPDWDILAFFPGLADADNLYLLFGTLVWQIIVLFFSIGVAGFFIVLHRNVERGRTLKIEAVQPSLSFSRMIRRAIVPAMFSFSIGEFAIAYLRPLGIFEQPNLGSVNIQARFDLFAVKTLHLSLLLLPLTLAIIISTWLLNDFVVVSYKSKTEPGEYSDPQKVGQWVSGLLSGFSIFAFPIAYLSQFVIDPISRFGPDVVLQTIHLVIFMIANVIIMLIAFVLPIIIVYELGRTRIAKYFYRVASRLKVENRNILLSTPEIPVIVDDSYG